MSSQVLSSKQGIFSALGLFERTRVQYWPAAVDVLQLLVHLQLPTTTTTWGVLSALGSIAPLLELLAWGLISSSRSREQQKMYFRHKLLDVKQKQWVKNCNRAARAVRSDFEATVQLDVLQLLKDLQQLY